MLGMVLKPNGSLRAIGNAATTTKTESLDQMESIQFQLAGLKETTCQTLPAFIAQTRIRHREVAGM